MVVEIWSDIVCPWCYIGKRRFEKALAQFAHRDRVQVVWRSYELDPDAPRASTENVNEMLARKYNVTPEKARAMTDNVSAIAREEGLDYHLDRARRGNTFDAHRLMHLAAAHGLQDKAKERLLHAYFTDSLDIGDHETLVAIASELGLPADETRTTLAGDAYGDEVRADLSRGAAFGIRGVPFFVIDERYGVSGAQAPEVLLGALEEAWSKGHSLESLATNGDNSCDDGSCAFPSGDAQGAS